MNKKLEELKKQFDENINSHVFLVETNNIEQAYVDIKTLIANILALDNETMYNQIIEEKYLELLVIKPEGKEIKKDQIELFQERLKTKPVLSDSIFYIINQADLLNQISANKLLKTIEEPNEHIYGFLITENSDKVLPTIKSRCELIKLTYDTNILKNRSEEDVSEAIRLILFIEAKDILSYNLNINEKYTKDDYIRFLNIVKGYYNEACLIQNSSDNIVKYLKSNNSYESLTREANYINNTLNQFIYNMNLNLLLEKIMLEMR